MDLYPASSLNTNPTNIINNGYITDLQQTVGMDGARNFQTRASCRTAVFDKNDDIFYIISTDLNNNKTITRYRFYEEPEPKPEDIFASKSEIKELKGEIDNVQQSIRDLTAAITSAISATNSSTDDSKHDGRSEEFNKKYVPKNKPEQQPNRNTKEYDGK